MEQQDMNQRVAVSEVSVAMQEAAMYGNGLGLSHIVAIRDAVARNPRVCAQTAVRLAHEIRNEIPDTPTYIDASLPLQ